MVPTITFTSSIIMTHINHLLIVFVLIGLLAVGFFAFGENVPLNSLQTKDTESLFKKTEAAVTKMPVSAPEDSLYSINKKDSELIVRLFKEGIASAFAHNHVVRAGDFSGWVVFKKDCPELFKMEVEVPSASLIADHQKEREKYNLRDLNEDDRKEINESMKGSEQMHVKKYPIIRFRSSNLEKTGTDSYTITGDFTLHGTTKKIKVPADITIDKNVINISGEFRFLQSDYGIEPYSAGWGTIKNKDEVVLLFDLYATEN